MVRRWRAIGVGALPLVCLAFVAGPRPRVEPPREALVRARISVSLAKLPAALEAAERPFHVREGTAKGIRWADGVRKTPLALVYLHGFSASRGEISPVMEAVADRLGANVYFARLAGHGLTGQALADVEVRAWFEDGIEAILVGRRLGDRVLVVGTSTGATLATWLSLHGFAPDAMVLLSPNFGPRAMGASLLTWPWLSLALPAILGSRSFVPRNEAQARFWTTQYPIRAAVPMEALVETTRAAPLERIAVPSLFVYSSRDEIVDVDEIARAYARFPRATRDAVVVTPPPDEDSHVIAGIACGPSGTAPLIDRILAFAARWTRPDAPTQGMDQVVPNGGP